MNYREKIRKAIACPQFGDKAYGEWGALNLEQRKYIKRLLDELDRADNYFKSVYLENQELKKQNKKYKEVIDKLEKYIRLTVSEEEFIETEHYVELLDILKEVE